MVILDSNVWIAYLNKNDSQHKKAEQIFQKLNKPLILPEYIILEICSVLAIRASKNVSDKFIKVFLYNQDIQILLSNEKLFINTLKRFLDKTSKKLSFVDAALLHLSKSYEIITFDLNLQKAIKK